jgi:hypothetical protein
LSTDFLSRRRSGWVIGTWKSNAKGVLISP